jgi:uncharacterized membrane protein YdjX (TVP38/TMEM64 family)
VTEWITGIVSQLSTLGPWGPVLFVLLYIVASLTMAPAFILTFAAGAVWGLWWGSLYVYIGAVLGASAVHFLAGRLVRTRVTQWLDREPRVAAVRRAVAGQGVWIMFLLRLSPLIPFVQLNYALVLSGVRYRDYVLATMGMWPTIIMYVYYGKVAGDVAALATGVAPQRGPEYYAMLVVGLVATVVATTMVARAAKRAMVAQAVTSE